MQKNMPSFDLSDILIHQNANKAILVSYIHDTSLEELIYNMSR